MVFDDAGQITQQNSTHGSLPATRQEYYAYDDLGQLIGWTHSFGSILEYELYFYDSVGNRKQRKTMSSGGPWKIENYDLGRHTNPSAGPNQMLKSKMQSGGQFWHTYSYDPDGSMNERIRYNAAGVPRMEERFEYSSWRGLSWKYEREDLMLPSGAPDTWEYR